MLSSKPPNEADATITRIFQMRKLRLKGVNSQVQGYMPRGGQGATARIPRGHRNPLFSPALSLCSVSTSCSLWMSPPFPPGLSHRNPSGPPALAGHVPWHVPWIGFCVYPPHQKSHVEALTPTVTVSAHGAFEEIIQVKRDHEGGALILQEWRPL